MRSKIYGRKNPYLALRGVCARRLGNKKLLRKEGRSRNQKGEGCEEKVLILPSFMGFLLLNQWGRTYRQIRNTRKGLALKGAAAEGLSGSTSIMKDRRRVITT